MVASWQQGHCSLMEGEKATWQGGHRSVDPPMGAQDWLLLVGKWQCDPTAMNLALWLKLDELLLIRSPVGQKKHPIEIYL